MKVALVGLPPESRGWCCVRLGVCVCVFFELKLGVCADAAWLNESIQRARLSTSMVWLLSKHFMCEISRTNNICNTVGYVDRMNMLVNRHVCSLQILKRQLSSRRLHMQCLRMYQLFYILPLAPHSISCDTRWVRWNVTQKINTNETILI